MYETPPRNTYRPTTHTSQRYGRQPADEVGPVIDGYLDGARLTADDRRLPRVGPGQNQHKRGNGLTWEFRAAAIRVLRATDSRSTSPCGS